MPNYQYTAINRDGNTISGTETIASQADLEVSLRKRRLLLVKAKETKEKRIGLSVTTGLVTEMSRLLVSGIAMDRMLQIVAEDTTDPEIAGLAGSLRQSIKQGQTLSRALELAGRFDPLLPALVRVGEASGKLPEILVYLENHYQTGKSFRSELMATLAYPLAIAILSALSLVGLAIYVIPTFRDIFAGQEAKLPLGTRFIFGASEWLLANGLFLLLAGVGTLMVFGFIYRSSETLRRGVHFLMLRTPIIGYMVANAEAAKLLSVLGLMLQSGVPLITGMELAQATLTNLVQRASMAVVIQQLRKGVPIPEALDANMRFLPKVASRFIRLGNDTGRLPESCSRAADLIQKDLTQRIKAVVSIIDPIIIVCMGGIVGFIVSSMLLAVFGMSDVH
jgi:general secretion pathway protein F